MTDPGLLTAFSRALFRAFAEVGLRHVVLSPGSRSTPFLAAAVAEPRVVVHDVADERAAAFFALGQARVTGEPSLLLCTSGTAGAHYLPAIIEAGHAHVPLVVLTADRPFELVGTGAHQTIDQSHLYGRHVRGFFELLPGESEEELRGLRRIAQQAMFLTRHPTPGAVHLNARAQKPLEPKEPGAELAARVSRVFSRPATKVVAPRSSIAEAELAEVAGRIRRARRGLMVLGPQPLSAARGRATIAALAAKSGFAVYAEATSQHRGSEVGSADLLDIIYSVEATRRNLEPDLILELGAPSTSTAHARLTESTSAERIVVHRHGHPDPAQNAAAILLADPIDVAEGLLAVSEPGSSFEYRDAFLGARRAALDGIEGVLGSAPVLTEAQVAVSLMARLPAEALLVLGNSLAVRHVDMWAPSPSAPLDVLSQRGVSGIDGLVAGAAGAASLAGRPVVVLLGDVSLGHDLTSLMLLGRFGAPVVVVALQNRGGRIFEQLPIAKTPEWQGLMEHFLVPPAIDLGAAASAFGVRFVQSETKASFEAALVSALATPKATLIEAVVPPEGAAELKARVQKRLEVIA